MRDKVAVGGARPVRVTEVGVSTPGGVAVGPVARCRPDRGGARAGRADRRHPGAPGAQPPRRRTHAFPPATLEALVEPVDPTQRTALFAGLTELADEDPLIALRLDEIDGEAAVSLHGEVQKEVIGALLEERYGVCARFSDTSVVCLERVVGTGAAVDRVGERGNPYLASVGLRVEARPVGHGVEFSPGVERGNLPPAFVAATEEGVRAALGQGPHGWVVTDCKVTMTESTVLPPAEQAAPEVRQVHLHRRRRLPLPHARRAPRRAGRGRHAGVPAGRPLRPRAARRRVRAGRRPARPARRRHPRDQRDRRLHAAHRAPAGRRRSGPGRPTCPTSPAARAC